MFLYFWRLFGGWKRGGYKQREVFGLLTLVYGPPTAVLPLRFLLRPPFLDVILLSSSLYPFPLEQAPQRNSPGLFPPFSQPPFLESGGVLTFLASDSL